MKKRWIVAAILGLLAIAFTVALKFVDVRPVGPAMTEVGFGTTNSTIFTSIKAEKNWLTVSNIMIAAIIVAGVLFAVLNPFNPSDGVGMALTDSLSPEGVILTVSENAVRIES